MARSGSGWRRIGHSGPESEGQEGSQEVLSQVIKGIADVPRVIVTDKLRSYTAARTEVMPSVEHIQQEYQNNRAENSHQPTRLREKVMRGFKSSGHAQRFLSAFGIITSHFRVGRHLYRASDYRAVMKSRFAMWKEAIRLEAIVN
jgi:putative transposase